MGMQRRWNTGGRRNIPSVGLTIGFGIEFVVTNAECGLLVVGRIGRPMVGTGTCRARISVGRIFGGHLFIQLAAPSPLVIVALVIGTSWWRLCSDAKERLGGSTAHPCLIGCALRGLVLRLHVLLSLSQIALNQ